MTTLFIADLHLSNERPAITELFIKLLQGKAREAEALYILGDLFEVWLGDDLILPDYQPAIHALRELSGSGVPVYVMHGNRDFLMGETFAQLSGCQILPEASVINLYGRSTLLMHGDTLCIDDHAYLAFREKSRNPEWQAMFLALPTQERIAKARALREESRQAMVNKTMAIMDVNAQEVVDTMRRFGVDRLIHGHTHRPATHQLTIDGKPAERIVLGDWYKEGCILACDNSGCALETFL